MVVFGEEGGYGARVVPNGYDIDGSGTNEEEKKREVGVGRI